MSIASMSSTTRQPFTEEDDLAMCEYLYTRLRKGDADAKMPSGNAIWQKAVRKTLLTRSVHSLQSRWSKYLRHNIHHVTTLKAHHHQYLCRQLHIERLKQSVNKRPTNKAYYPVQNASLVNGSTAVMIGGMSNGRYYNHAPSTSRKILTDLAREQVNAFWKMPEPPKEHKGEKREKHADNDAGDDFFTAAFSSSPSPSPTRTSPIDLFDNDVSIIDDKENEGDDQGENNGETGEIADQVNNGGIGAQHEDAVVHHEEPTCEVNTGKDKDRFHTPERVLHEEDEEMLPFMSPLSQLPMDSPIRRDVVEEVEEVEERTPPWDTVVPHEEGDHVREEGEVFHEEEQAVQEEVARTPSTPVPNSIVAEIRSIVIDTNNVHELGRVHRGVWWPKRIVRGGDEDDWKLFVESVVSVCGVPKEAEWAVQFWGDARDILESSRVNERSFTAEFAVRAAEAEEEMEGEEE